ncbi:MAG: 50S ribosomal protein L4 [Candidatus Bipolaricaulota bacterium]|nr:50S ribosomal protein L4 [Candidatus Bipolaricaulota bacterium]MDW8140717.1 50S ribosomal protein L4 [Candidatus Bipolaricaulota bacterium]
MNLVAPYYKFESGAAGEIQLSPKLFGYQINKDLLYRAVRTYLLNLRQGTHATKTRGEVVGTGKKPWPQKHTGRARHGMRRSPLWKGGGIVFGPRPKEYDYRLPKKMVRRAMQSALIAKLQAAQLGVLDRVSLAQPKTKEGLQALGRLGFPKNDEKLQNELLLVVSRSEYGLAVKKTFANLPWAKCVESNSLTVYDLLKYEHVLITEAALGELEARCAVAAAS